MRSSSQDVRSSLRGNARARHERGVVDRLRDEAIVLDAVATRVEDLTDLLLDVRGTQSSRVAVDPTLREPAARVLHAAAAAVRPLAEIEEPRPQDVQVRERLQRLSAAVEPDPPGTVRARHAAGAVVTALRRLLGALPLAAEHSDDDDVVRPSEALARTPRTTG